MPDLHKQLRVSAKEICESYQLHYKKCASELMKFVDTRALCPPYNVHICSPPHPALRATLSKSGEGEETKSGTVCLATQSLSHLVTIMTSPQPLSPNLGEGITIM